MPRVVDVDDRPPHPFSHLRYFVFKFQQPGEGWTFHDDYLYETNAKHATKALLLQGYQAMVGPLDVIE